MFETVVLFLFALILVPRGCWVRADNILTKMILDNPEAVCNDFSSAVYYQSAEKSNKEDYFIIFFEGGGGCSSFSECNEQWLSQKNNPLMSSNDYNNTVEGRDLLSSSQIENPIFYNYTHILVPYCSQDIFLANRSNPFKDKLEEVNHDDADNFIYKGRIIFQSIIKELISKRGLANATEVILAGSSAGGLGIINNLEWTNNILMNQTEGVKPHLSAIIDSSWFVPFAGSNVLNWDANMSQAFNLPEACLDVSLGHPCCTAPACLLTKGYLKGLNIPIFIISSMHDIYILGDALRASIRNMGLNNDYDILRLFNGYGSIINKTLTQSYNSYSWLSIFSPSCTQHVYFATSSLWDENNLLWKTNNNTILDESNFLLTNPIENGTWEKVLVQQQSGGLVSLQQAIMEWQAKPWEQRFYIDNCTGPACGESCPSTIEINPKGLIWQWYINIIVLVFSGIMTAIPVILKLGLYFHMKYIIIRQKLYLYNMSHTPKCFPKATIPVNIACIDLAYRINTVSNNSKTVKTHLSSSTKKYSEVSCNSSACVETFFPCCKKLCSGSNGQYNASILDKGQQRQAMVQLVRTDSGISTSVNNHSRENSIDTMSVDSMDSVDILDSKDFSTPRLSEVNKDRRNSSLKRERRNNRRKRILHKVNMYVNPGELVAIMGPSGAGKTTLLDVLLGRRTAGHISGEIMINGTRLEKIREWFVMNTGYVRQLAKSYYNDLTVRENLIFSMCMQAPSGMKLCQKLERVEQVIREMGLVDEADILVGDGIGLGLSGGQRKRLAIALQLLSMPNIIFLDEPTSGLDSASSLDILKSLQVMSGTGRAIVVTIHQPRSEIFHAFDKILLLCNGQVAFYGSPVKVWEFFRKALIGEKELDEGEGQVQDAVLDLLKEKGSQRQVLLAYKESNEPKHVQQAILESGTEHVDFQHHTLGSRNPGIWHRLMVLESRASLRQTFFTIFYLPIVYTVFGLVLGTTYLKTSDLVQIMSVTCLLSCSSSLFMSSIIASLLVEPLKLFYLEHSDGISSSYELILQVFIRMSSLCTLPLSVCSTIIFALVYQNYEFLTYVILLLAFLLVNQVWISIFIVLTVLAPSQAHRLCPIFAAVGGFCCGFIVPKQLMPPYYRWIFYINPSFYAYATTSVTILEGRRLSCDRDSKLECFRESGPAILSQFGLTDVNPIQNLVVLTAMVITLVFLGIIILQVKVSFTIIKEKLFNIFCVAASRRKRRQRVTSMEHLLDRVDHPTATCNERNGVGKQPTIDGNEVLTRLSHLYPSSQFLDAGYHYVLNDFPWKREEHMRDFETDECDQIIAGATISASTSRVSSMLFPQTLRQSRVFSDGSEDVFEPESGVDVSINMEEEMNEEQRRMQANLKWNLRRLKIDQEINRLRHYSINKSRAAGSSARFRHSVSFGDDLEIQLESSRMRVLEDVAEEEGEMDEVDAIMGAEQKSLELASLGHRSLTLGAKSNISKTFIRSMSMPGKDMGELLKPSLRSKLPYTHTYKEDEEAGEEQVGRLGLPPKDIPFNLSTKQLEDLIETDEVD